MKCRYEGHTQAPEQRDVDPIDMGVQHIELARLFGDPRQHCAIGQHWVRAIAIQPQRLW